MSEVLGRALLKWRNAYAAQKQAELTHRAAVDQLDAAEYELAVVLGAVPPPRAQPAPPPWMPPQYPPNVPGPAMPPNAYVPPVPPQPAPVVDERSADEIVMDFMKANPGAVGGG